MSFRIGWIFSFGALNHQSVDLYAMNRQKHKHPSVPARESKLTNLLQLHMDILSGANHRSCYIKGPVGEDDPTLCAWSSVEESH